jgi:hypothetical protein
VDLLIAHGCAQICCTGLVWPDGRVGDEKASGTCRHPHAQPTALRATPNNNSMIAQLNFSERSGLNAHLHAIVAT